MRPTARVSRLWAVFQDQGFTLFHSGFATDAHTQHVEEGRWVAWKVLPAGSQV